jgi:signal transduction histidine kinase
VLIGSGRYHPPLISPESVIPESLSLVVPRLTVFLVLAGALGAAIYALLHSLSHSQQRETQTLNLLQQERDLLERRVIERTNDLAKARDQALQASNFKSQLLSRVSHELRTPLNGVLGFAELLKMNAYGALNERQTKATVNIIDSAHYLTHMVNDLLDEAQIEAGTILLNITSFSPTELLKEVSSTLSVLADKKGLVYVSECSSNLPDKLHGDVNRLRQLITNLAGNAVKFTQAGEVRVRFLRPSPGQWVIQISDTGVGISKDAQEYIFDAFRQVDNSITRENRGSGLGLSITRQIVELMGGQLSLESAVGIGSTFTIALPIAPNNGETT